jgi:hypothetical protein
MSEPFSPLPLPHHQKGLRYVVLRHEGIDSPHFDFMVETAPGALLATWRSITWPPDPAQPGEKVPDHRREYLEYEGPISNNRGNVVRVESGLCHHSVAKFDIHVYQLEGPPQRKIMMRATGNDRWVLWQV